jgi:hypothetical protein
MEAARPASVAAVPGLDELDANPALAETLSPPVLRDRARRAARLAGDLQALLLGRAGEQQKPAPQPDRLILIDEAAKMLATSEDTLYSKWKRLPFAFKDPLDGKIKFTVSGIEKYVTGRLKSGH